MKNKMPSLIMDKKICFIRLSSDGPNELAATNALVG
jgi:hypothetical protein